MALTLFPEQSASRDVLVAALKKHSAALDSSDMGTGKTVKAVEVAKAMGLTPFVVCPKSVITTWKKTIGGQHGGTTSLNGVYNWEKLRAGNTIFLERRGKKGILWKLPENVLLIFDECHKGKGVRTLNANMMIAARRQGYNILCLSATAAEDPREMRALGYVLGLHSLRNYWQWAQEWGCVFDRFNSIQFPSTSQHRLKELNKLIYPDRGHKLTREDLGQHFQDCRVQIDPINFGNEKELKEAFEELEPELLKLEERMEADGDAPIILTEILRLRQKIELLKVPGLVDLIHESIDAGLSVPVFLNFTESIDAVSRRLKHNHVFLQGGQSKKERDGALIGFQTNKVRIILCNIMAGGVGIDLHDTDGKFPRKALISPTYNAKDFHQVMGRTDRLGGQSKVVQQVLVAAETIEQKIVKRMMEKLENLKLLHAKCDVLSTSTMNGAVVINNDGVKPDASTEVGSTPPVGGSEGSIPSGSAHAKHPPSSLRYEAACPGFVSAEGTNPAAEMGTRIHEALETGDWSKLNDFETSLAQGCRNAEKNILKLRGITDLQDINDFKEIKLDIELIGGSTYGTCDRLVLNPLTREGVQIDYKTGEGGIPEPLDNWQAKAYVTGAFQRFPELDTIYFYFIACRRDEILSDKFTRDMLPELVEDVSGVIIQSERIQQAFEKNMVDSMMLHPQALVCNYCKNAGRCPAVANLAVKVAAKYAPGTDAIAVVPGDELHGSNLTDPAVIAALMDIAPILKKAISGWEFRGKQMVFEEGLDIPGYEIAERSGRRKITSALAAYGVIKDDVDVEDFLDGIDSFPVTTFEKLVSAHAKRGKKKERVAEVMAELTQLGVVEKSADSRYLKKTK